MKRILFLMLAAPLISHSANNPELLNFKHQTELACFNPGNPEKQDLCEKTVKLMLLNATIIGHSEASCFGRLIKDRESCEEATKEYQSLMRYSAH